MPSLVEINREKVIPGEIRGRKVVAIGVSAFAGRSALFSNKTLTSVIIPDSVVTIRTAAFAYCKSLKYVYISKNIQVIGYNAFLGDTQLERIDFGDGAPLPGVVKFPPGLQQIGCTAFSVVSQTHTYLREITISRKTKVSNFPGLNTFRGCAVFYYEDQRK